MANQLASLARPDYLYAKAFWRLTFGMYIIIIIDISRDWLVKLCEVNAYP